MLPDESQFSSQFSHILIWNTGTRETRRWEKHRAKGKSPVLSLRARIQVLFTRAWIQVLFARADPGSVRARGSRFCSVHARGSRHSLRARIPVFFARTEPRVVHARQFVHARGHFWRARILGALRLGSLSTRLRCISAKMAPDDVRGDSNYPAIRTILQPHLHK